MAGIKLRTAAQADYTALGTEGSRLYSVSEQLRTALRRRLNARTADIFAIPRPSDRGDTIDWFAPMQGHVVPWSAASPEERQQAQEELMQVRARIQEYAAQMERSENHQERHFGKLLEKAMFIPGEDHIYLVGGRPVLTCWGFASESMARTGDIIPHLITAAPRTGSALPVAPGVAVAAARKKPWWLLALLLLLLLGVLGWLIYRYFMPQVSFSLNPPAIETPVSGQRELPVKEAGDAPFHDSVNQAGGDVTVHDGTNGATVEGATVETGGQAGQGEKTAPAESKPDAPATDGKGKAEDKAPPEDKTSEDKTPHEDKPSSEDKAPPPPEKSSPETKLETQEEKKPQAKTPEKESPANPPKPLTIPPDATANGNTDFLNGHWKSHGGLMDQQTGKPIKVEYDFKDGKGEAHVTRPDGTVCKGAVQPGMNGGTLSIKGGGALGCADGTHYTAPDFTCGKSKNGNTTCQGLDTQGQKYPVRINQITE